MPTFLKASFGICCSDKRHTTAVGYETKRMIGDEARPLSSLILPMLNQLAEVSRWPTTADMLADLENFRKWAEQGIKDNK